MLSDRPSEHSVDKMHRRSIVDRVSVRKHPVGDRLGVDRRSLGLTVEVRTERTVQQTHTATPSSQIPESVS